MRLPWFMHAHAGRNTLTGILPTPVGTFVRSNGDGRMEVVWYPMDPSIPGGTSREAKRLAIVNSDAEGEIELEDAVRAFMHAHETLCLHTVFDHAPCGEIGWTGMGGDAISSHTDEVGMFVRILHAGVMTVEFLPANGFGKRETIATMCDACGEETLRRRVDAAVRRRIEKAQALAARRAA